LDVAEASLDLGMIRRVWRVEKGLFEEEVR